MVATVTKTDRAIGTTGLIEAISALYMFAMVLSTPVDTEYLQMRMCEEDPGHADPDFCHSPEVSAMVAQFAQNVQLVAGVPALFVAAYLGAKADTRGRKPALVLALSGAFLGMCVFVAVTIFNLPVWMLYIRSAIYGLTGFYPTVLMATFSMTIDSAGNSSSRRTVRVAVLEGFNYFGIVLSTLVSGPCVVNLGYSGAAIVQLGAVSLALIGSMLCPETLDIMPPATLGTAKKSESGKNRPVNPFKPLLMLNSSRNVRLLALAFLLVLTVVTGVPPMAILFTSQRFNWSKDTIGYWLALDRATRTVALLVVLPVLRRVAPPNAWYARDRILAILGTLLGGTIYLLDGLFPTTDIFFGTTGLGVLAGFSIPVMRALVSKCAAKNEQGSIMAAFAVVESASSIAAPLLMAQVFSATAKSAAYVVFIVGSAMMGLAALLLTGVNNVASECTDSEWRPLLRKVEASSLQARD